MRMSPGHWPARWPRVLLLGSLLACGLVSCSESSRGQGIDSDRASALWAVPVRKDAEPPVRCPATGKPDLSIRVCGSRLVDGQGQVVQLRGVNIAGLEGVAIFGWSPANPWGGQTGTPTPDWQAIKSWGVNSVRVPLNEASWLGLSCVDYGGAGSTVVDGVKVQDKPAQRIKADPGGNYQSTVLQTVREATAAGLYVIVDLHWSAPGDACPMAQNAMADADHSIDFWSSVATAMKGYANVMLELFNEPYLDYTSLVDDAPWPDLRDGNGTLSSFAVAGSPSTVDRTWHNAGMQQMLDAVRKTGASNVVLVAPNQWAQSISGWLKFKPTDSIQPAQIAAVWHVYPAPGHPAQQACRGVPRCSAEELRAVQDVLAAGFPVLVTEFGDEIGKGSPALVSRLLPFADALGIGYLGFCWDTWNAKANVLITNAAGEPTPGYGAYVKAHFLCRASGRVDCP